MVATPTPLDNVRTPSEYGYYMDCWLCSLASILRVTYYEAYVLFFGGPPPAVPEYGGSDTSDLGLDIKVFEKKIERFGLVPSSVNYQTASSPRFLIGCYVFDGTCYGSLHCVVYDPVTKKRVDPAGKDTFRVFNARVIKAYRLKLNVRVVTGVTIHPPTSEPGLTNPPHVERDMTNHRRRMCIEGDRIRMEMELAA